MVKIERKEFCRLIRILDFEGNERNDWRNQYLGDGLIVVVGIGCACTPERRFARFYTNEPESRVQNYITTTIGFITEEEKSQFTFVTKNSRYIFSRECNMSATEKEIMLANIDFGLMVDEQQEREGNDKEFGFNP